MITAKEASDLYDKSGQAVKDFLKNKVEPKVIKAAESGKLTVFILVSSIESYRNLPPEPELVTGVIAELKKLGYHVTYGKDMSYSYIPAGLRDASGDGPTHVNYGYSIGW